MKNEFNQWHVKYHSLFQASLTSLVNQVLQEKIKDPANYKTKAATKLLASVYALIKEEIPQDPNDKRFRLGLSLGKRYKNWRRGKPAEQYRLFFKFSLEQRLLVYAWLNDQNTLRAYNSKTDAYRYFQTLLASSKIPDDFEELKASASPPN